MASTSNPKQGRKRRVLTLEKKLDIIKELKGGKSQRCVSELHQVPKSAVADIWKEREKIKNYIGCGEYPSVLKKRCIMKEALFSKVDCACYEWFMQYAVKSKMCFFFLRCDGLPVFIPSRCFLVVVLADLHK